MSPAARIVLGSASVPLIGLLFAIVQFATPYVPDVALRAAATDSGNAAQGRAAVAAVLHECLGRGWRGQQPLPAVIRSLENDAGFLATTRIACMPGRACAIEASALIPHRAAPDRCDTGRRRGRRFGWNDSFAPRLTD